MFGSSRDEDYESSGGSVWVRSKKDPRWNRTVYVSYICFTAGPPDELLKHIEQCKLNLGTQPDDLEWGGTKN